MYNGWKNRETWTVALWLNNDEGLYLYAKELVEEAEEPAEALKSWVHELCISEFAGLATDLLGYALSQVDYNAIVEGFTEE